MVQLISTSLAALCLHEVTTVSAKFGSNYVATGYSGWQGYLMDVVLTMGLVSVILGTTSGAQNIGRPQTPSGLGLILRGGPWKARPERRRISRYVRRESESVNALPEAFPLALAASIYPPTLVVLVLLLSGDRPRRLVSSFYAGAGMLTVSSGLIVLALIMSLGLTTEHSPSASGWTYIVLGASLLAFAVWATSRGRRPPQDTAHSQTTKPGRVSEWSQRAVSSARWAFALGLALFLPSPFYLLAIKDIADSGSSTSSDILAVVICAGGVLVLIESALAALLLRPKEVSELFRQLDGWLRRNGWTVAAVCGLVAGIYGLLEGFTTLA